MSDVISTFFQLCASLWFNVASVPLSVGVSLQSFVVSAFVVLTVTGLFFRFRR